METYILKNAYLEVHVLNYGGIIDKIYCKDCHGKMENVVLSFENKEDYINIPGPYLNALVGPTAGRIANGRYQERQLSLNDGSNHLHGGFEGISKDIFDIEVVDETKLIARLSKKHEKDGYHGTFNYEITYSLDKNALVLSYDVNCSEPNLLYLTNHAYFNLSGGLKHSIHLSYLKANFKKMMEIGETGAPSRIVDIENNSLFDFSDGKQLGVVLDAKHPQFEITRGIDHPFFVNGPIKLFDPTSKRCLTITSDAPCAVLYSANYIDETMPFENGTKGYPNIALAIELQDVANGIHFGLGEERTHYTQTTSYCFDVEK